jgi:hypothetical protein
MKKYVIDTSSLRDLKDKYPIEFFEPLWFLITELNNKDKLLIIDSIKKELINGSDFLSKEFLSDKKIIKDKIPEVVNGTIQKILDLPPSYGGSFGKWLKKADPWLIAYSLYLKEKGENIYILTQENINGEKLRIPFVANRHDVKCVKVFDFFREEGIKFNLI